MGGGRPSVLSLTLIPFFRGTGHRPSPYSFEQLYLGRVGAAPAYVAHVKSVRWSAQNSRSASCASAEWEYCTCPS
jgi:hypothetical protein